MPSRRPAAPRAILAVLAVAWATVLLAVPTAAADATVTGSVTFTDKIALSSSAVAIVTIVDQTASADAGVVIGQARIDAPGSVPIDFSVLYDATSIDKSHSYALFASIVDGGRSWQNRSAVPVITGGPTSGVAVTLTAVPSGLAQVTGSITLPSGIRPTSSAVSIAALIKQETGTLVSRDVRPVGGSGAIAFSIPVDLGLVDPGATYVVKAGLVDGPSVWQNTQGVPGIVDGQAATGLQIPVTAAPVGIPVATPKPTVAPTPEPTRTPKPTATVKPTPTAAPTTEPTTEPTTAPTTEPTTAPTAAPTTEPTTTPTTEPTAAPTATPTPTPTPTPTATPTATPTPTPTPSASPSATASATPSPITGPVTGTLTYAEPHRLSADAFAAVALVQGTAKLDMGAIVASQVYHDIGQVPVAFKLTIEPGSIDPTDRYTLQATIVDGDDAWITAKGVDVLTKGAPTTVDLELSYRPDLLKGEVTGQVTAVGLQPAADAYAITVLTESQSGSTLGINVQDSNAALPIPFGIPFPVTEIDQTKDYVVTGAINDGTDTTWETQVGVPVITKGNPTTGVQVVVSEVVPLTPVATPTPAPTTAPATGGDTSGGTGILLNLVIIGSIVAVVAAVVARLRTSS